MVKNDNKYLDVKLFMSDVDGVLTDAGMYYSESGDELKKFSTLDGGGIILLRNVGIQSAFLTSERTEMVTRRSEKLQIDYVLQGVKNKRKTFEQFIAEIDLTPKEVAYIGDDINDLPVLELVGVSATVPGNCLPLGFKCDYMTIRAGGDGAVRDFAEWLLRKRGDYEFALSEYFGKIEQ